MERGGQLSRRVMLCAALVAFAAHPRPARAGERAIAIGSKPAWFVLAGVTSGATVGVDERGWLIGGEVSGARLQGRTYVGLYADGFYDLAVRDGYVTAGPELGLIRRSQSLPLALGIDAGVAARVGAAKVGVAGRLSVAVAGLFSVYGRYLQVGLGTGETVVQVGVTLKFPLLAPSGPGAS